MNLVRVLDLELRLPEGFEALEDADTLTVSCPRCVWVARYSARGADRAEVLVDALEHMLETGHGVARHP